MDIAFPKINVKVQKIHLTTTGTGAYKIHVSLGVFSRYMYSVSHLQILWHNHNDLCISVVEDSRHQTGHIFFFYPGQKELQMHCLWLCTGKKSNVALILKTNGN